jgi:FkbM family methyltransferase
MKLFNREPAMILRNWAKVPAYLLFLPRCFIVFRNPMQFIAAYMRMEAPSGGTLTLRNGMVIHLSSHPHDVVTVFLIFVRQDYGRPVRGSAVVDIGANIGVFSLFAAYCGASRVIAYEPNSEAFRALERNIHANHLESIIESHQFAVTDSEGKTVHFPKASSAYNRILPEGSPVEYETINTINLAAIMRGLVRVDLLKLDCEGAEWDILRAADRAVLEGIHAIRMEYHMGLRDTVTDFLETNGFTRRYQTGTKDAGTMWFDRRPRSKTY